MEQCLRRAGDQALKNRHDEMAAESGWGELKGARLFLGFGSGFFLPLQIGLTAFTFLDLIGLLSHGMILGEGCWKTKAEN